MNVNIAVVGAGRFGQAHLDSLEHNPHVNVSGFVEPHPLRRREIAESYELPAFESVEEMLRQIDVDALTITVPTQFHEDVLMTVAAHDIPLLIEKPLTTTVASVKRMMGVLDLQRVMVGHILRFTQAYQLLRAETERAETPLRGRSRRVRPADHLTDYPFDHIAALTMSHDLDAAVWITGERVERVHAQGRRSSSGQWYEVEAELTLTGGETWNCSALWGGNLHDTMCVAGNDVDIRESGSRVRNARGEARELLGAGALYDAALDTELTHFVDLVRGAETTSLFNLADAAHVVAIAEAIATSLDEGAVIDVAF